LEALWGWKEQIKKWQEICDIISRIAILVALRESNFREKAKKLREIRESFSEKSSILAKIIEPREFLIRQIIFFKWKKFWRELNLVVLRKNG